MHLLSQQNRSEFLACPQLVRFDYARGRDGFEPTLLIKGSTLLVKYIILGAPMRLAFAMVEGRLLCALQVYDDGDQGGVLWSAVEREEELNGIRGLARGETLVAFLFNELAVNVAWNNVPIQEAFGQLSKWATTAGLGPLDHSVFQNSAEPLLARLQQGEIGADWLVIDVGGKSDWKPLHSHYITASASSSLIDIFDVDEGNQQEQVCLWLTDNLQPLGACHSPQIPKGNGTRELTDILLSYEHGAVLIESKTLSILGRERLPDRAKLKRDVATHVSKAFNQLRGAIRALSSGVQVLSPNGEVLSVGREKAPHAIVLIPDLELIDDRSAYGTEFIRDFVEATGGIPHMLDISELLRVVQAAEMIAARGKATPIMAFDYYLMQRAKRAVEAGSICIEVVLRFVEEQTEQDQM